MNQLRVHLLGKFSVRHPGDAAVQFHSQKEEELLCYLLVNRGRLCPREALASLLWGETETACSKKYLRTALWHLKSDLKCPSRSAGAQLLKITLEWIQLRRGDGLWADIDAVEEASALMQRASDKELSLEQASAILETIRLYQGEFLEGWHQAWCLYERERFQQIYFRLIDRMMAFCEDRRDFHPALELGMRLLRQEPARECTHRRMMRLYDMAGDRYSAIRQFERCVEALREELGVRPSQLTLKLYEEIRTARGEGPNQPSSETVLPANLSLKKLLDHLGHVRTMIESIETLAFFAACFAAFFAAFLAARFDALAAFFAAWALALPVACAPLAAASPVSTPAVDVCEPALVAGAPPVCAEADRATSKPAITISEMA